MDKEIVGSDIAYTFYCEICNEEGLHVEAVGYCTDCDDYLCTRCISDHKRNRVSRTHKVQNKDEMPRDAAPPEDRVRRDISTVCVEHKGETVQYFCKSHKVLACSTCAVKSHRPCDIEKINEVAQNVFREKEYKTFDQNLDSLQKKLDDVKTETIRGSKTLQQYYPDVIEAITEYRTEINSKLDKLEKCLKEKVSTRKSDDLKKLRSVSKTIAFMQKHIDKLTTEFNGLKSSNRVCQTYVRLKETAPYVDYIEQNIRDMTDKCSIQRIVFQPNQDLRAIFKDSDAFGSLIAKVEPVPSAETNRSVVVDSGGHKGGFSMNPPWPSYYRCLPKQSLQSSISSKEDLVSMDGRPSDKCHDDVERPDIYPEKHPNSKMNFGRRRKKQVCDLLKA